MSRLLPLLLALPLALVACGDKDAACEEGAYQCDGNVLQVCDADGAFVDDTDCDTVNMECHAEMGHCMDMGDDDSGS